MQSQLKTPDSPGAQTMGSESVFPGQERKRASLRQGKHNFVYWDSEAQRAAFLNWLPKELHDVPGINWAQLSPNIMRYCIMTIKDSPDAAVLAVAAASMRSIDQVSQQTALRQVNQLLRELRATGQVQNLSDLRQEEIWYAWAERQQKSTRGHSLMNGYAALAVGHMPRYLHLLEPGQRQRMQHYLLPPPPLDLREKYFPYRQVDAAQKAKRKSETDVLTPLYPVLRQLVRLRKQLAERMIVAIRSACHKVEAGEVTLPYHFEHSDVIPEVKRDAITVADLQILGRQVTMPLILWNKSTWVLHHQDRYDRRRVRMARRGKEAYTPNTTPFLSNLTAQLPTVCGSGISLSGIFCNALMPITSIWKGIRHAGTMHASLDFPMASSAGDQVSSVQETPGFRTRQNEEKNSFLNPKVSIGVL